MNNEAVPSRRSREETIYLIQKAQAGSEQAKEQLILEHTGLVRQAVRHFYHSEAETEDLMQIGYIGLLKAIQKFDVSFGVQFSTYAVPMIFGEIRRFLRDDGSIKMSRPLKQEVFRMKKCEEALSVRLGRSPTIRELADDMNVSSEKLVELLHAGESLSCMTSLSDEEKFMTGTETVAEDTEHRWVVRIDIRTGLAACNPRERQLIFLRYFCDLTQQQTGERLGISQVQVSRLEKRILSRLKSSVLSDEG